MIAWPDTMSPAMRHDLRGVESSAIMSMECGEESAAVAAEMITRLEVVAAEMAALGRMSRQLEKILEETENENHSRQNNPDRRSRPREAGDDADAGHADL